MKRCMLGMGIEVANRDGVIGMKTWLDIDGDGMVILPWKGTRSRLRDYIAETKMFLMTLVSNG